MATCPSSTPLPRLATSAVAAVPKATAGGCPPPTPGETRSLAPVDSGGWRRIEENEAALTRGGAHCSARKGGR